MKYVAPLVISLSLALPGAALAAGGGTPASGSSETAAECENGTVWDKDQQKCVAPSKSGLSDDALYETARNYAVDGRIAEVPLILDAMAEGDTARVLTMRGFAKRKSGEFDAALDYYQAALEIDPTHWQAMSYMGQGYVEAGDSGAARALLTEIRMTGGRGTWEEISLRDAIAKGAGYSY